MIKKIRSELEKKATGDRKKKIIKSVPTAKNVYGVKTSFLNELAKKYKDGGFKLVRELWESDRFEEKLLASKILGKVCNKDPDKTIEIIKEFSKDINDWAVCDTLAIQGIRRIIKEKEQEALELSRKLIKKSKWQKRFALVLLINFAREGMRSEEIKEIMNKVKNDKEYYVKKALDWLNRENKNNKSKNAKT